MEPGLLSYDPKIIELLLSSKNLFLDGVLLRVTQMGDGNALISISTIIVIFLLYKRLWLSALICLAGFLGSTSSVGIIKTFIGRERPINNLYSGSDSFSFPSGHMTNTTVVIGTLGILIALSVPQKWRAIAASPAIMIIFLMGLSRVYLGAHWPSDVIAGLCFGFSILLFMQILIGKFEPDFRQQISPANAALLFALTVCVWAVHLLTNSSLPAYNL